MEQISFSENTTWKITAIEVRRHILKSLYNWWNKYDKDRFPGPLPVSIERQHFPKLSNNPYWVCAKTDGVRYLMVCIKSLDCSDKQYCVLINRRNEIFLIQLYTLKNVFDGTVLDGELIKNKETNKYDFLVYDATRICGEDTTKLPHSARISKVRNLIHSHFCISEHHGMDVKVKTFMELEQISTYNKQVLPYIPYENDGLIFTPENDPVTSGTSVNMFKWKPLKQNTVDFWVECDYRFKNRYIIKLSKGPRLICLHDHYVHVPPRMIDDLPGIVECAYNGRNNWVGLLIREDKSHPNHVYTMTKTLLNIQENILVEEFENVKS